jgi:3-oxoacyl-[acyl-carrier-protein] synthase II
MGRSRVVITGLGAVSPLGLTCQALWEGLKAGMCGIGRITAFDPAGFTCQKAGQVPPYRIQDHLSKTYRKAAKLMARDIELAVIAADQALRRSGWVTRGMDPEHVTIDPLRTSVNLGAGLISCDLQELAPAVAASVTEGRFDIRRWGREGLPQVTPLWLLKYLPNMLACHVSIIHDLEGPCNSITCAEVSSHLAIAEAKQILDRGDADVSLVGGAEAKVTPLVLLTQCLLKRTADGPEAACRPFDAQAHGSLFGEGAGVLVLENADVAGARGAKVLAEVAGVGHSCSLNARYESLEPDGQGVRIAIEKALADAGIGPDDLDLVVPHGTGIPADDAAEANGIVSALGPSAGRIPVWPTKGQISNTGAAAGVLDVIAAVSAMQEGLVPGAVHCKTKAPGCRLNIGIEPQRATIRYALCCAYTYGGLTAAIVLKNPDLSDHGEPENRNPKTET